MKGSDGKLPFSPSPPLPRRAHSEAAFEETGPFLEHSKLSCQFQSRISPGNSLPFSSLLDPLGAHVPAPLEFVLITRPFLTSLTSSRPSYLSFSPFSLFRWPFHPRPFMGSSCLRGPAFSYAAPLAEISPPPPCATSVWRPTSHVRFFFSRVFVPSRAVCIHCESTSAVKTAACNWGGAGEGVTIAGMLARSFH